jgi:hypothetical protein
MVHPSAFTPSAQGAAKAMFGNRRGMIEGIRNLFFKLTLS